MVSAHLGDTATHASAKPHAKPHAITESNPIALPHGDCESDANRYSHAKPDANPNADVVANPRACPFRDILVLTG